MAGTIVADTIQADSTSTLVLKNGVANTPPTIQDSAGTQIGTFCRAWVNFNGTTNVGGFCTIRSSFNVTTVADNGTGNYTVNFTTAMPDANFSACCSGRNQASTTLPLISSAISFATTSVGLRFLTPANTDQDSDFVSAAIFR